MIIVNVLEDIFNTLFIISIFISIVTDIRKAFQKKGSEDGVSNKDEERFSWHDIVKIVVKMSAIVVVMVGIFLLLSNKVYWPIMFIGVPMYLERIIGAYLSFGIVENVVKSKDKGMLSFKERLAIKMLAYALWCWSVFQMNEKLIEQVYVCKSLFWVDVLAGLSIVGIIYLYIFFICSLLPELIVSSIKFLKIIYAVLPGKNKIKRCGDFFVNKIDGKIDYKSILIWQWETLSRWNKFIRWIRYVLIPITFVLDIIMVLINIVSLFICDIMGYVFTLARMIKKTLSRVSRWILELSDKRVVVISFRVALVMALLCVVILNRYQTIFKFEEESTAVLEFIASAIIIPVVFDWISSVKNR